MTSVPSSLSNPEERYEYFLSRLTAEHGSKIGGEALRKALAYPTMAAFLQAAHRRKIPVPLFKVEGSRSHFAYTRDVARWLAIVPDLPFATAKRAAPGRR